MKVSDEHAQIINEILQKHFPEARFIVFGSRVIGSNKKYSDIDLAIHSRHSKVTSMDLANAKQDFIDSDLPFSVDLVNLNTVSESLKSKIEKEGKDWKEFLSLAV